MSAKEPQLVLGPLLRYVGSTTATVWVETDAAAVGRGAGPAGEHVSRARAPLRAGRARGPRAGLDQPVRRATRRTRRLAPCGRPPQTGDPDARRRAPGAARLRLVPGRRAGAAAVHARAVRRPEGTRASTRSGRTRGACSRATRHWPDGLVLLGDQVYADEVPPETADVHPRAAGTSASRRARRSPTSRSTRSSTASRGPTRTSAGCSRRCRRR